MRITDRDRALFRWINGFGFVFISHVAEWMGVSYPTASNRIRKLKQAGFLTEERKASGLPRLLYLSNRGWQETGDTLPRLRKYNRLHTFSHDVRLIGLSLHLRRLYPDSIYTTERWLWYTREADNRGHVPDGELLLPRLRKPVAIELELSRKKTSRIRKIIRDYRMSLAYDAVWYFTAPDITPRLRALVADDPLFSVMEVSYTPCL